MKKTIENWDPQGILEYFPEVVRPSYHPVLPNLTDQEILECIDTPDNYEKYVKWLQDRERLVKLSGDGPESDPFRYGIELEHWKDADKQKDIDELIWLILLGGNRSAKSEYCAKRVVKDALHTPDSFILCIAETEKSSIETQQKVIFKYLPIELRKLNGKKDVRRIAYINYSVANGFSDQQLVLANRTKIRFATYNGLAADYEGIDFGNRDKRCIGAWADESLTMPWFQVLNRRLRYRNAVGLWSFTPVKGMTPTIKEAVGDGKILETREAELLPDKVNVPGCPVGHMPYIQEGSVPRARVMYFFSKWNPFGSSAGTYYKQIKELCEGKPSKFIQRVAYGYSTDTTGKAFPLFSGVNVIKPEQLPTDGTNYHFLDPAGARNFASIWVRVAPNADGNRLYIYRDWPDQQTYGEWAVPTERDLAPDSKRGWDGDPGPAQSTMNLGYVQYKELFKKLETTKTPDVENDPYRKGLAASGPNEAQEAIAARFIDSRAGRDQHAAENSGTCLVDQFAETNTNADGDVVEPMLFYLASGVREATGLNAIESLLYWDTSQPYNAVTNSPKLFVSSDCQQVIWAMSNYTGKGGETGACKDFIDLVRYAALADLMHIDETSMASSGGGSY